MCPAALKDFRANKFALWRSNYKKDYVRTARFHKFGYRGASLRVAPNAHRRLMKLPLETWVAQCNIVMKLRIASDNGDLSRLKHACEQIARQIAATHEGKV